jgi:hypothetical protein
MKFLLLSEPFFGALGAIRGFRELFACVNLTETYHVSILVPKFKKVAVGFFGIKTRTHTPL